MIQTMLCQILFLLYNVYQRSDVLLIIPDHYTLETVHQGYLQNLDSGLDHGLTAIQALINLFHYNITVLPIYAHS